MGEKWEDYAKGALPKEHAFFLAMHLFVGAGFYPARLI
jgi:hypothetical protein